MESSNRWAKVLKPYAKYALPVSLVLAVGYLLYPFGGSIKSDVPRFELPTWTSGTCMVALRVDHRTGNLLIMCGGEATGRKGDIYEYDQHLRQMRPVSEDAWNQATGKPCWEVDYDDACCSTFISDEVRVEDGAFWRGTEKIATEGRTALSFSVSPSDDFAAVLSADGRRCWFIRGPMPFRGGRGGGYSGQHYVEFFTLPEVKRKGPPVRIPLTTGDRMSCSPQWTAGGEYVVYQKSPSDVCIIPTFKLEEER